MTALAAVAAIIMGIVLGTLGGGGSIMAVPILVYLVEAGEKAAIATSLLVVGATSAVSLIPYARRNEVVWKIGLTFGVFAMIGAAFGGWLAQFFSGTVLIILFAVFMFITAAAMFRKGAGKSKTATAIAHSDEEKKLSIGWIAIEGITVGAVTGLVGAGGGFLVVPALVLLGGLDMKRAIGTSLLVIAMKSFTGFASFATHVEIDYALAGGFAVFAVIGGLVGQSIGRRIAAEKLKTIFAGFVLLMAIFILSREFAIAWPLAAIAAVIAAALTAKVTLQQNPQETA